MDIILVFIFGTMLGSFASFLSYRLAHDNDVFARNSTCPKCNHKLGFLDLFPVLSWLFLAGKCRYCEAKISIRYPLIEISAAFSTLLFYYIFQPFINNVFLALCFFCLFLSIITDLEHYIIPESLQFAIMLSAILHAYVNGLSLFQIFLAPFIVILVILAIKYSYIFIRKKDGLGLADVTLLASLTIIIGLKNFVVMLFLSGIFGVIFGLLWTKIYNSKIFPFAPAIIFAFIICITAIEMTDNDDLINYLVKQI